MCVPSLNEIVLEFLSYRENKTYGGGGGGHETNISLTFVWGYNESWPDIFLSLCLYCLATNYRRVPIIAAHKLNVYISVMATYFESFFLCICFIHFGNSFRSDSCHGIVVLSFHLKSQHCKFNHNK